MAKMLAPLKKGYDKPRQIIKSRVIILQTKVCIGETMVFPVVIYRQMCELGHQEG